MDQSPTVSSPNGSSSAGAVACVWDQFGPYHMDRMEALGALLGHERPVLGLEMAGASDVYAWEATGPGTGFEKICFFPDHRFEQTSVWGRARALIRTVRARDIRHLFVVPYNRPDIVLAAAAMRLMGRRVYAMFPSKFDDKPRFVLKELTKLPLFWPYHGVLAGSARTIAYCRFLGVRRRPVLPGYDTVSTARLRAHAAHPDPIGFADRPFVVVARFVPKKNLPMLLEAYAQYRGLAGNAARGLRLCGSGPMEADLKAQAERLGLSGHVAFPGFLDAPGVAREIDRSVGLLLPSLEEQFGLVINESLALARPVIVSDNVGARDYLVRSGINGFVVEPHNAEGWARAMARMGADEAGWTALCDGSKALAPAGDAALFADACRLLIMGQAPAPDSLLGGLIAAHDRPQDLGL